MEYNFFFYYVLSRYRNGTDKENIQRKRIFRFNIQTLKNTTPAVLQKRCHWQNRSKFRRIEPLTPEVKGRKSRVPVCHTAGEPLPHQDRRPPPELRAYPSLYWPAVKGTLQ